MKTILLAKVSDECLLKTLDPAVSPEEWHRLNQVLITIVGGLVGVFFGILVVFCDGRRKFDF